MRQSILLAATALLLACAARAEAGRFFCHHCGCCQNCKKICRLKCEKKKDTKTEYVCECEDFCVPGPSKKCGVKVERDCDGHHRTILWQPTCARVRTRKKLVKKEVTKEVPDYKWEVEEYCCVCGHWVKVDRDKAKDKDEKGGEVKSGKDSGRSENPKPSDSDLPRKLNSPNRADVQDGDASEKPKPSDSDLPKKLNAPKRGGVQESGDSENPKPSDSDLPKKIDPPKAGAEQDGGDSGVERLPTPRAEPGDRQARWPHSAEDHRARNFDAQSDARLNIPTWPQVQRNLSAKPRRLGLGPSSR